MAYKKMLLNVTSENADFLADMKSRGQLITDSINLALDTYRAMIEDQQRRRNAALEKQRAAAQQHVRDLFEAMEFKSPAFKKAWIDEVMAQFDYIKADEEE